MPSLFIFAETSRYKSRALFCQALFNTTSNCSILDYAEKGIGLKYYVANQSFPSLLAANISEANSLLLDGGFFSDSREQISYVYTYSPSDVHLQQTIGFAINAVFLLCTNVVLYALIMIAFCKLSPGKRD